MPTPSLSARLLLKSSNLLRRVFMDTNEEITQAEQFQATEVASEKIALDKVAAAPVLTNEEFQVASAAAYRFSLLEVPVVSEVTS